MPDTATSDAAIDTGTESAPPGFGARVAAVYAAQFLFVGLYLPFFPVWLKDQQLADWQISTILSLSLALRVLASAQVMKFADRQPDRSRVVTWLYFGSAFFFSFYLMAEGFLALAVFTLVYNLFFNPILPLIDAVALAGVRRFNSDYGPIRIWGSIAFIAANFAGGMLLAGAGSDIIIWALIAMMWLGALVSFALPRIGRQTKPVGEAEGQAISLWKDKHFTGFLLAIGLVQATHGLIYGFGSIHWQSLGFSGNWIGLLWAIGVIAEIILFRFTRGLKERLGARGLFIIGCAGAIVRWSLFPFVEGETAFFFLQILHGLSFGANHLAMIYFIAETVGDDRMGEAQGVGFVLGGVSLGVAVFASGPLYSALGGNAFAAMAIVAVLALIIGLSAAGNKQDPANSAP